MPKRSSFQDLPLGRRPARMPLHRWLYDELRRAILEGRLKPGMRLPSTRSLSRQQSIARVTVVAVFEQLRAEGYIVSRTGSGTVVAPELPDNFYSSPEAPLTMKRRSVVSLPRAAFVTPQRREARRKSGPAFDLFRTDLDVFPKEKWRQIMARRLRLSGRALLEQGEPGGYGPLRVAIAAHLSARRSVRCEADQVVIVSGTQQALDFIARITLRPGDVALVENPGYPGAVRAFEEAGARIVPIPVDESGFEVKKAVQKEPRPKLVYLTPAHQFPLGGTLTSDRRLALLTWAERNRFWIFEDDYDGDYRYDVRPIGSMQGDDRSERVIYAGSFNKLLFPSLRLGYVVLPRALAGPFLALRDTADRYLPTLEQAALADFIQEGHFERHIRRSRALYLERHDCLLTEGARNLRGLLDLQVSAAGFHLLGRMPDGGLDTKAEKAAAAHDVIVTPLSIFYLDNPVRNGLLLGFASVETREIIKGVERLAKALGKPTGSK